MITIPLIFLLIAVVLFGLGAWFSRWNAPPSPAYHYAFVSAGLFFWSLSQLWAFIAK
jgi:hypothetical protein